MSYMTDEMRLALRKPFAAESVGKLPKSACGQCSKSQNKRCDRHTWVSNCPECHGGHTSAAIHLDYVGHAAVTDRLLTVDPEWTWEPMALDDVGLPALDRGGNLWIKLTIGGVTRIGVGDGKSAKECIGDAIRNAAMRFGVALDLWAKDDLVEFKQAASMGALSQSRGPVNPERRVVTSETFAEAGVDQGQAGVVARQDDPRPLTDRTRKAMFALINEIDPGATDDAQRAGIGQIIGRTVESRKDLTEDEGQAVVDHLRSVKRQRDIDAVQEGRA